MPYYEFIWDEEPGGNVEHIAENGLSPEDVEEVMFFPLASMLAVRLAALLRLVSLRTVDIF
ncbi:MAG: hypothetical protein WEA31_08805 [Pirellulales bacterium]